MIVGLLKEIFKWSLSVANKGKSSWCFYVKKLLIIHTDLGHLNPENVTCLSAKEFQTITIVKLIQKRIIINGKCESGILMPIVVTQGAGYIIIE